MKIIRGTELAFQKLQQLTFHEGEVIKNTLIALYILIILAISANARAQVETTKEVDALFQNIIIDLV